METKSIMFTKSVKKKVTEDHKKNKEKKRVIAENWTFTSEDYAYENQFENIKNIKSNTYNYFDDKLIEKYMVINNKILLKNF